MIEINYNLSLFLSFNFTIVLNIKFYIIKFPEYLSAGLAVVASPGIGDISNLIVDENLGVLVDPNDIVKSAFEIQNFLDDFELNGKEYFSSKAHKIAQEKYDWSSYINEYNIIYN